MGNYEPSNVILSIEQAIEKYTQQQISNLYNCSKSTISSITRNKTWN